MARADLELQILKLSADIKRAYLQERRQFYLRTRGSETGYMPRSDAIESWDGGRDARGVNHKSIWEAIAKFALQHQVDPVELVRATFEMCNHNEAPLPNMVKSQKALEALKYVQENNVDEVKRRFSCYAVEAKRTFFLWRMGRDIGDKEVWKEVVTSPQVSFSALFRFLLANDVKLEQAAEYWKNQALQEYIRAPNLYNEALGDNIPASFREEAARTRAVLNRG